MFTHHLPDVRQDHVDRLRAARRSGDGYGAERTALYLPSPAAPTELVPPMNPMTGAGINPKGMRTQVARW